MVEVMAVGEESPPLLLLAVAMLEETRGLWTMVGRVALLRDPDLLYMPE